MNENNVGYGLNLLFLNRLYPFSSTFQDLLIEGLRFEYSIYMVPLYYSGTSVFWSLIALQML